MEARHTVASTLLLLDSLVYPGSASCSAPVASPLSRPPVQTSKHKAIDASVTIIRMTAIDVQPTKAADKVRAYRAQAFSQTIRHFAAPETSTTAKPAAYMIADFQ